MPRLSDEQRQREMWLELPYEKWPLFAKAMAWDRDPSGNPSWMTPEDRAWFWREVDSETAKAEKRAAEAEAWENLKAAVIAPFVPVVEWLARRLPPPK